MRSQLNLPIVETAREWSEFQFIALWNTVASIANLISLRGHGDTLVIVPHNKSPSESLFRPKYRQDAGILREAFIRFMNARHKLADIIAQQDSGHRALNEKLASAELEAQNEYNRLVEATRFVAHLAGCDGAILMTGDLRVLGFGCELRAELRQRIQILELSVNWVANIVL